MTLYIMVLRDLKPSHCCFFITTCFIPYIFLKQNGYLGYDGPGGVTYYRPDHDCLVVNMTKNTWNVTYEVNEVEYDGTISNKPYMEYEINKTYPCLFSYNDYYDIIWFDPWTYDSFTLMMFIGACIIELYYISKSIYNCWRNEDCRCHCCRAFYYCCRYKGKTDYCIVCMDAPQSVLLNCGHNQLCYKCARKIYNNNERPKCPTCKKIIRNLKIGVITNNDYINPDEPNNNTTPSASNSSEKELHSEESVVSMV